MNDKDKEAFERWYGKYYELTSHDGTYDGSIFPCKEAWQAACEYKDVEIKKLSEGCCCSAEEQYTCVKCKWERHEAD
jgi:hypothetical protein